MSLFHENPRSLRLYFLLVGGYGFLSGGFGILAALARGGWFAWTHSIVSATFGLLFVVAGILLQRSLPSGARWILGVLVADAVYDVLRTVLALVLLQNVLALLGGGLALLITSYLYLNIRRLAREHRPVGEVFE